MANKGMANRNVANKTYRYRDVSARRSYMREYMKRKRAGNDNR